MASPSEKRPARRRAVKKKRTVLDFASTHDTILAEKLATGHGFEAEVIPRPPGMTGRCGVALQVAAADLDALTEMFAKQGLADFNVAEG
ncbi:MAG: DUF3343 domain-containing protein [candidate division Zixibacteria bacterium]|nr:DUF3343 domain-containing protein [candidate division Zixibacteria bacterium]